MPPQNAYFPTELPTKAPFFHIVTVKKRHFHSKSLEKARFCQTNTHLFGAKPPIFSVVRNLSIYISRFFTQIHSRTVKFYVIKVMRITI